jgi:hypothetical protein
VLVLLLLLLVSVAVLQQLAVSQCRGLAQAQTQAACQQAAQLS